MWLSRLALALGLAAVLLLVACGPGARFGLWPWQTGFLLLRMAVFVGGAAAVLSLAALVFPTRRSLMALVALVLGVCAVSLPLEFQRRARAVPPINDISTAGDTAPGVAAQQRRAYPDIRPLALAASPPESFKRALEAARAMGWEIVSSDAAAGRIEAVATTFWFGFKDDVTVHVAAQEGGSRVDVRSTSRVGRGDAGTNARRIREYLKRLQ